MKPLHTLLVQNPMWNRVLLFCLALFFLRIADGIIAFWAPNQIQEKLGSSVWMGLVISFQSVIGLVSDIFLPGILRNTKARKLLIWACFFSAITSLMLIGTIYLPYALLFLAAMAIWGIYYEFLHFAQFQFIGTSVGPHFRSSAWGVVNIFANISYFLGPLIATFVMIKGIVITEVVFLSLLIIGLFLVITLKVAHETHTFETINLNPITEIKHWIALGRVVWPVIAISVLLGFIDSTFWTTGAVWTGRMSLDSFWGGMILPFYQLPSIFLGLVVAKWGIYKGKKLVTEKFLMLSGLFLMLMALSPNIFWILLMVFLSAVAIGICYPLTESIYTDLIARMGHEGRDMMGLSGSTLNIAYIIFPPVAGFLTAQIGERMTFSYLGFLVILIALGLLLTTPKKLRLPQNEIKTWE